MLKQKHLIISIYLTYFILAAGCSLGAERRKTLSASPQHSPTETDSTAATNVEPNIYPTEVPADTSAPRQEPFPASDDLIQNILALDGQAFIISADGEKLGIISSNRYDSNSICNSYGSFGSRYSSSSVWNQYSSYGSQYSDVSAFNPRAKNPPIVIFKGQPIVVLTKNGDFQNSLDPQILSSVMCSQK